MLNQEELNISNKSYINLDFQTIYPELVELVKKLTNRWDPETTNESDPMSVLLKLLAFVGDKSNYFVDKRILEAYLPSATQETSVRQLLETNGYTKKYYQSASTTISVLYSGDLSSNNSIYFKAFETQFTDTNNSITYTLLQDINILNSQETKTGLIIEGSPKDLTINGNTSIQLSNLDENYRLYFPETMVAQNGIYVKNVESNDWNTSHTSGDGWVPVDNLNLYSPKSKNFKFGFDSNKNLPYIQFPDDIIELIGNGLNVKYIVTTGDSGNISRGRLTVLSNPTSDNLYYYNNNEKSYTDTNVILNDEVNNQELLRIFNYYASTNGQDPETINEAYNNYKKTVGTFNTLVAPRDFANWLYSYIDSSTYYPLVSNIQVSDRRIDSTFYQPIITYSEYGATTKYQYVYGKGEPDAQITPFDLVLYPLKQVSTFTNYDQNGNLKPDSYDLTFTPDTIVIPELINVIQDAQSIDHTYKKVGDSDPYLYKNMYTLNVKVSTIDKVNEVERRIIVNNIKQALFDNFNSRKVDYGYEIPVDTLYNVILNADTRIKNVFLDDPVINTRVVNGNGVEGSNFTNSSPEYIDMIARNVLAGKVNLYEYLDNFEFNYSMSNPTEINNIISLEPKLELTSPSNYTLGANQVVQLFSDSYSTSQTATVGVNYYWSGANPIPANETHEIINDEALYLSYTNSEDVLRTYKYTENTIVTYDENGAWIKTENVNTNIIEPTFTLNPTNTTTGIKVNDDNGSRYYDYLSSSQEIKFKKKNEKVFDMGKYYFYWKVNNSENKLFPANVDEIVLGEEEYLMYTDSSKSSVEIFSSGTKITKEGLANVNWTCDPITTSELIDGDLSTYAGINWVGIPFDNANTLTIAQQTILTLTENDIVTINATINEVLTSLGAGVTFTYQFSDATEPTSITNDNLHNYRIRTRLDILCGPDLSQTLTTSSPATETIDYVCEDDSSGQLENTTFITNYLIQRSGNGIIDVKLEGAEFNIITYTPVATSSLPEQQNPGVTKQDNQYKITFKDLTYTSGEATVTFNIPIITNCKSVFMVYYNKDTDDNVTTDLTDYSTISDEVTMIETDSENSVTFTITSDSNSKGYLIIDAIKITDGVNSIFNLDSSGESALINRIDTLRDNIGFYSTYTIPYAKVIDVDDFLSANVMWDKNNVLNKFTLPQIDFKTSKIDVLKSSLK